MKLIEEYFSNDVLEACKVLVRRGFQAYIVGGSIRDIILEKRPKDWDIATNALPSDIINVFNGISKVIPTGIKHGTVTIFQNESTIEITTFRSEKIYKNGRRPSDVTFINDIKEDLSRRDLTINAIAYDPIYKNFIDPFQGIQDIEEKILRMVGDPDERLEEDGLRIIRIFRFMSELGFKIEPKTYNSIPNHFKTFTKVAKERIQIEFQKLLLGEYWIDSLLLIKKCGLLYYLITAFSDLEEQNIQKLNMNRSDISFKVLLNLDTNSSLRLRYAALLHQISALKRELSVYFPNYNENQIKKILKDMKFSNKQIEEISHILLIHNIPLPYKSLALNEETRDYYMRRFQYKVRPEYIKDYVNFFKAKERVISSKIILTPELENDILERAKIVQTIELKDLIINGDDIIKFLDIDKRIASQRELIGLCLRVIRERVEADPNSNTKVEIEKILIGINKIIYQCRAKVVKRVHIISTDHIRRLYSDNSPKYALWENEHTYKFANWLALCLLRKRRKNVIIFDGTNFNLPSHPRHREKLNRKFNDYNPIYIHTEATEEEIKSNYEIRVKEIATIQKSDADLNVYFRYKQKIESYPNFLKTPANRELIKISTRSPEFKDEINKIAIKIHRSNHRFIIISGNVLSGKTYLSNALEAELERLN